MTATVNTLTQRVSADALNAMEQVCVIIIILELYLIVDDATSVYQVRPQPIRRASGKAHRHASQIDI